MAAKKAKNSARKTVSKSAFVRGLPSHMPAKEVSAKAKAAGLDISDRYVHVIRSIAKRGPRDVKAPAASTKVAGRRGGRPISSKRTFVLSLPADVSASEVIKRAKAQGMKLSTNYVYKIRSRGAASSAASSKPRSVATPVVRRARATSHAPAKASKHGAESHEERFLQVVLEVGLSRAAALLDKVRARVRELAL